ncbi:hypothetical protein QFZ94_004822 [Paraburkholderia sp. JPY465]|uniref:hypothetical protein n=1 Tax=Paraburkholderia sp. JPY465 TaxID=3042285 RepID=UPI003D210A6E
MITDQFQAKDDNGNVYGVVVHQDRIDTSDLSGRSSLLGMKEFRLSDGRSVNRISETEFEIVQTRTKIKRI